MQVETAPFHGEEQYEGCEKAVLTAIDETIVVLMEGLVAVAFLLECHCGDTLGASARVKVKSDVSQRADGSAEEILECGCSERGIRAVKPLLTLS